MSSLSQQEHLTVRAFWAAHLKVDRKLNPIELSRLVEMDNQPQIVITRDFELFLLKESNQIVRPARAIQITNELALMDVTLTRPIES